MVVRLLPRHARTLPLFTEVKKHRGLKHTVRAQAKSRSWGQHLKGVIHSVAHHLACHLHLLILPLKVAHDLGQRRQVHLLVHDPHGLGRAAHRVRHSLGGLQRLRETKQVREAEWVNSEGSTC